ncbi:MAG: hypothetical protein Q9209_001556 [Squamulea sp. 1 TL-2023]
MGALYGADLKASQDVIKVAQRNRAASTEEVLAQLQASRKGLIAQKIELERKIGDLENKRQSVTVDVVPKSKG